MHKARKGVFAVVGKAIRKIEEAIIIVLMAEALVVGVWQVAARYAFHAPLPWSEEMLRFSFEWITFLAASIGVSEKAHVSVSVVVDALPRPLRGLANFVALLISAAFCGAVAVYGFELVKVQLETVQLSPAMEIPMWIPYLAVVAGSATMALRFAGLAKETIVSLDRPEPASPAAEKNRRVLGHDSRNPSLCTSHNLHVD